MLVDTGVIVHKDMIYWDVRPSANFPTVEIRVADIPATVDETVLLATLIRAAVMTALDAWSPALDALGEYDRVTHELDRIAAQGNGAMRQLRAWRKGGEVMDVIAESAAATLS